MTKSIVHLDLYYDRGYEIMSEWGYLNDLDLTIFTDEKQVTLRLHKEQAYALLHHLKDRFE